MIQVLFFGPLAELAGVDRLEIENTGDVDSLRTELLRRFPSLTDRQFAVAVNTSLVRENVALPANSIIALLPPFSGG